MPVFLVTCTYVKTGTQRQRRFVAVDADEAQLMAEDSFVIRDSDTRYAWTVAECPDPDGSQARRIETWQ